MSPADDRTDAGQALHERGNNDGGETQLDAAELESQSSDAIGTEGQQDDSPQGPSPTIKEPPRTPTQRPVEGGGFEDEEFSDFQRPSSADGSLSIPDDLPSAQVRHLDLDLELFLS